MNLLNLILIVLLTFLVGLITGDLLGFDRGWERHEEISELYEGESS